MSNYAQQEKLSDKALQSLAQRIDNLYTKGFKLLGLNKYLILSNKHIKIMTDRYAWIAQEVFYDEIYKLPSSVINKKDKYCVLDIGANRAYTALYFAQKKWVKRVDSFELIPQTFNFALKNIKLNNTLSKKIHIYNIGLGAKETKKQALYIDYRDGISTINNEWLTSYAPAAATKAKPVMCNIAQSSVFLKNLIEKEQISNIIFKIDVEGAEYEILQDLADNYPEIFNKIEIMIGDTHCGFEKFLKIISPFNFKIIEAKPETNGSCSFVLHKNKY